MIFYLVHFSPGYCDFQRILTYSFATSKQYLCNIYQIYSQYLPNICKIFEQYSENNTSKVVKISRMFTQYFNNILKQGLLMLG